MKTERLTWDSTPPINILEPADYHWLTNKMLATNNAAHAEKPVAFHKRVLGRQDFCWIGGSVRFWIWEGGSWRVFVSNSRGVCFEVREGMKPAYVRDAVDSYMHAIGLQ